MREASCLNTRNVALRRRVRLIVYFIYPAVTILLAAAMFLQMAASGCR